MNRRIEIIDNKLSLLFDKMDYSSYLSFIKNNLWLRIYDTILGRVNIEYYPKFYKLILRKRFLSKVEQVVDGKIKELGLVTSS